jgi:hypothetical protein
VFEPSYKCNCTVAARCHYYAVGDSGEYPISYIAINTDILQIVAKRRIPTVVTALVYLRITTYPLSYRCNPWDYYAYEPSMKKPVIVLIAYWRHQ